MPLKQSNHKLCFIFKLNPKLNQSFKYLKYSTLKFIIKLQICYHNMLIVAINHKEFQRSDTIVT